MRYCSLALSHRYVMFFNNTISRYLEPKFHMKFLHAIISLDSYIWLKMLHAKFQINHTQHISSPRALWVIALQVQVGPQYHKVMTSVKNIFVQVYSRNVCEKQKKHFNSLLRKIIFKYGLEICYSQLRPPRMLCCHCLPPGSLHILGAFGSLS